MNETWPFGAYMEGKQYVKTTARGQTSTTRGGNKKRRDGNTHTPGTTLKALQTGFHLTL